uniref:Uncharacterized protein n=1 Tax=Anopheles darlingi TaxID=43151 RepID=A0A2M4D5K0_ANODA
MPMVALVVVAAETAGRAALVATAVRTVAAVVVAPVAVKWPVTANRCYRSAIRRKTITKRSKRCWLRWKG